jgi:predicted DNA-binding protein
LSRLKAKQLSETANISLRLPIELIERIDRSAVQAGENRTSYIISYLPDAYTSTAEGSKDKQRSNDR